MDLLKEKIEIIQREAEQAPFLKRIEEKTGVKSIYIFFGLVAIAFILVFNGFLTTLIASIIGCLYPAYKSLKALHTEEKDDADEWLIYWLIYGIFVFADEVLGLFLSFVPFYFTIKLAFVIWLYFPTTKGAQFIYKSYVKDLFAKYQEQIDKKIEKIIEDSKGLISKAKKEATDPANIGKVIKAANEMSESVTKRAID